MNEVTDAPVDAAEAPEISPAQVTGESGTIYEAIDLERINGYHEAALMEIVLPIKHLVPLALAGGKEGGMAIAQLGLELWTEQLHRRAIALLYLPAGDQRFRADEVAAREKDLMELTLGDVVLALKGF